MRPHDSVPLTLEEHRELGAELRAVNARLQELCKVVVSIYGPNTPAAFTFTKATATVERLCQDLQAQAERDLPGFPIGDFYIALPGNSTSPPASPHSADPAISLTGRNNHR